MDYQAMFLERAYKAAKEMGKEELAEKIKNLKVEPSNYPPDR